MSNHKSGVVRLNHQLDEQVRRLAHQARQPVSHVLNHLVAYALERAELKPVQLYDIGFKEGTSHEAV